MKRKEGGSAEVYLCLDEYKRPLALKFYKKGDFQGDNLTRSNFNNEALIWVSLGKHTNIVQCFKIIRLFDGPCLALEWVNGDERKGVELRGWIERNLIDIKRAISISIDICRGMRYANRICPGIVHRDLKPENIFLTSQGLAKVSDFGLAQTSLVRHPTRVAGTYPYMSPEQWQQGEIDNRADIYAVGCIIFEMLTGKLPYYPDPHLDWKDWRNWKTVHENQRPQPLSKNLPKILSDIVATCLSKPKEKRFPSFDILIESLEIAYRKILLSEPNKESLEQLNSFEDLNNRAATYHYLEQYSESKQDYISAFKLNPDYADVIINDSENKMNLTIVGSTAYGTRFDGNNMRKWGFGDSSFYGCSFVGVNFDGAMVDGVFHDCNFSWANFRGANFSRVSELHGIFIGAKYNGNTVWPSGFDPTQHYMVRDEGSKPELKYISPYQAAIHKLMNSSNIDEVKIAIDAFPFVLEEEFLSVMAEAASRELEERIKTKADDIIKVLRQIPYLIVSEKLARARSRDDIKKIVSVYPLSLQDEFLSFFALQIAKQSTEEGKVIGKIIYDALRDVGLEMAIDAFLKTDCPEDIKWLAHSNCMLASPEFKEISEHLMNNANNEYRIYHSQRLEWLRDSALDSSTNAIL